MTIEIHKANGMEPRRTTEQNSAQSSYEPNTLREAIDLAKMMAGSDLVPRALRNNAANLTLVVMAGKEMGLGFTQSMRMLHVVDGKIVSAADLIVAMVKRSPECLFFRMVESTDKVAAYETQRRGDPAPTRLSYTIEQAQRAGLAGKDNWKKHPEAMLRARCSAALARVAYPDLAAGMYDTDEGDEIARPTPVYEPPQAATVTVVKPEPSPDAITALLERADAAPTVDALKTVAREAGKLLTQGTDEYKVFQARYHARMRELEGPKPPRGGKPAPEAPANTDATGDVVTGEHEDAPQAWTAEAWKAHVDAKSNRYEVANSFARHENELAHITNADEIAIERLIALGLDEAHAVEAIAAACDRRAKKAAA